MGKSVILDLAVEPEFTCLKIEPNNCNGGVLELRNLCDEPLVLGGVEIGHSDYVALDVLAEDEDDLYTLIQTDSSFSDYIPEEGRLIAASGRLGDRDIRVSFVKTAELC